MKMWPFKRKFEAPAPTRSSQYTAAGLSMPNWLITPGRIKDFSAAIGDPISNSAVAACMNFLTRVLPESPVVVRDKTGKVLPNHKLTRLVSNPVDMTTADMLALVIESAYVYGNSYLLKHRGAAKRVEALEFLPSRLVQPRLEKNLRVKEYKTAGWGILPAEDVVHFRGMRDPNSPWVGRSYLYPLYREICTDNEAAAYEAAILRNMGIPGVIITPADGADMPPDAADEIKQKFMDKTTGEHRGEPLVVPGKLVVTQLGFSPVQMNTENLSKRPEERICAVLGLSPMVVGLGAGIENSTYSNMAQAHEAAFENCIIPLGKRMASDLNRSLMIDTGDPSTEEAYFDFTSAAALQDDQDSLVSRLTIAVNAGVITTNEAREELGKAPLPGGDTLQSSPAGLA